VYPFQPLGVYANVWPIGILYPIAWGVCEGGNVISPDSEAVFYGVLDFLAKPIFGALLIWGHRGIDPARLGLAIKDYDGDALIHEKRRPVRYAFVGVVECIMLILDQQDGPIEANNGHSNGHNNGHTATTAV
jgi:bacteriorhodopsin